MADNNNPTPVAFTVRVSEDGLVDISKTYKKNMLYVIDPYAQEIGHEIEDGCYSFNLDEIPEIWEPIQGAKYQSYVVSIIGRNEDDDDWSEPATATFNYNKKVAKDKKKKKESPAAAPTPSPAPTAPPKASVSTKFVAGPPPLGPLVDKSQKSEEKRATPQETGRTVSLVTWIVVIGLLVLFGAIILVGVYRAGVNTGQPDQDASVQGHPTQEPIEIPVQPVPPTPPPSVNDQLAVDGRNVRVEFRDNRGPITFVGTSTPSLTSNEFFWDYVDEIYLGSRQPGSKQMEIEKTVPKGKRVRFLSPHGWSSELKTRDHSAIKAHVNTEGNRRLPQKWTTLLFNQAARDDIRESYLIEAPEEDVKITFVLTPYD